jgi:hypothetical protein
MDEEQAKEKIKQIETKVRDAILQETTTIRTKVRPIFMDKRSKQLSIRG